MNQLNPFSSVDRFYMNARDKYEGLYSIYCTVIQFKNKVFVNAFKIKNAVYNLISVELASILNCRGIKLRINKSMFRLTQFISWLDIIRPSLESLQSLPFCKSFNNFFLLQELLLELSKLGCVFICIVRKDYVS